MRVSEIHVKRIRVNQGLGVIGLGFRAHLVAFFELIVSLKY